MRRLIRILVFSCLATGLPMAAGASAEPSADAPKTELERLHHAVGEIGAHIINAGAKLKNGAVSMGGRSDGSSTTPAVACCGNNIETIEKNLKALAAGIGNLRTCYGAEEKVDELVKANLVQQDAGALYRALNDFRKAGAEDLPVRYGTVMRGHFLLKKSAKELTECPGVEAR